MMRHVGSFSLCLAVLGLAVSGCKSDPSKPEHWEKRIADAKNKKDKLKAVEELRTSQYLNATTLPVLRGRLAAEKAPEVKGAIARVLGEQKDLGGLDALMGAVDLGSTDSDVKAMNKEIATALGALGDAKAVPALVKLLGTKDNYTVISSIEALGALRAKEAAKPLIDFASNDAIETFITKKVVIALGDIGDPAAVPVIVRLMFKERKGVSFYLEASFALYQLGQPAADALIPIVNGQDKELLSWAEQNRVLPAALTAKAAQVLGDMHDLRAEKALLDMLAFKSDMLDIQLFVRMRAADALGRMRSKNGGKALAGVVGETEPTARQAYAWSLSRIGGRDAVTALLAAATKGSWDARMEAFKALAMVGDERELAFLEKAVKDEPKSLEAECKSEDFGGSKDCEDLAAGAKKHQDILAKYVKALEAAKACKAEGACWAKKLDDETLVVRERAAYELGRSGDAAMVTELTKRLREKDLDARLAVIQGCDWLIHDSKDALATAKAALPDLLKQLGEERGKTEFVKVNEDLRRLAVKMAR